ncbi:sulfotransferase [Shewanella psychrotolerans]|uniref:sulfotransferase n=1 Tax=Shewanella psychrotolerans TaxID=2864206 RepID=UPI001C65DEB8|nr:sulfotransferase [Shewanella psychrotolerans]QYK01421.1 sulfotransferase family protein [Shewanella psychrotolerans]
MSKVFIIGLPRTGTTSVSVALLEMGFKVAHQAFTKQSFELADVVSDAPCFSDYRQLHKLYPNAKFVYLERALDAWVPSMQMLLSRMLVHLDNKTGKFHPILKRSFDHCFDVNGIDDPLDAEHLVSCYLSHKGQVFDYFKQFNVNNFMCIDISQPNSLIQLHQFLASDLNFSGELSIDDCRSEGEGFPHLNRGRNVASWDEYKHPNKVSTNAKGPDKRKFFDYKLL